MTVRDNGLGVDAAQATRIFTMFSRANDEIDGSGIGLAVCRRIIEAHGGRIWVESKGYDEVNFPGSKFHVVLPLSNSKNGEDTRKLAEEVNVQLM